MKHYSPSQINMALRCGAQYKYRYIDGLIKPPASALIQGQSVHKGIEVNYGQKINTHTDLPMDDVLDAYGTYYDEHISEVEEPIDRGALKDEGYGLTKAYHAEIAPSVNPTDVEKKIEIKFNNVPYSIIGYIDYIDNQNIVRDAKTSSKTPSDISSDYMLQGAIYSLGTGINKVKFDFVIKNKTPKTKILDMTVDDSMKQYVLNIVGHLDRSINNGDLLPNRSSFMCSKKSCGYWRECLNEWGGVIKE